MKNYSLWLLLLLFVKANSQNPVTVTLDKHTGLENAGVVSLYPNNNYSNTNGLEVLRWTVSGQHTLWRSYLNFDLSSIPPNAVISEAKLKLYHNSTSGTNSGLHSGSNSMYVRRLTQSWDESLITWNNKPNDIALDEVTVPASTSSTQDYEIVITDIIDYLHANPVQSFGFMLRQVNETPSGFRCVLLCSSRHPDTTRHPQLEITYTIPCPSLATDFNAVVNGQNVSFTNLSAGSGPLTYRWDFGDGDSSNATNPIHYFASGGTYYVCLETTDTCGTLTYCDSVTISCSHNSDFTYQQTSGLNFNFTSLATGTGTLHHVWTFGDGYGSLAENPTHTFTSQGSFEVCLEITDTCGTATYCEMVNVSCPGLSTGFSYVMSGRTVSFTNHSAGSGTLSYSWDFGDGGFSFSNSPTYTFAQDGNFYVCLTATDDCGSVTFCDTLEVCLPPSADFAANLQQGRTIQFVPALSGAISYLWDFDDGNFSVAPSPTYTYQRDGVYNVCLHISDTCGENNHCENVNIGNIGLDENFINQARVFPNPANDLINVEWQGKPGLVSLYNMVGELVLKSHESEKQKNHRLSLDVSALPKGVYIVKILCDDAAHHSVVVLE